MLTLVDNLANPLNNQLPAPVTTTVNALGIFPTQALTIKAEDKTKVYGAANPVFAVTYTGFVGSDDPSSLGGALAYLVDLPLDAKGKPPAIKKKSVVLFARAVPGHPGELQLVAPDAQLLWDPVLETRIKGVLAEFYASGAPPRITGVREAIHVSGELAGEGETQIFLTAANGEPAAITVSRMPGQPPRWGVSFSELVASDSAPRRESLGWYRLACFLPRELPAAANISSRRADQARTLEDYALVLAELGACPRTRR